MSTSWPRPEARPDPARAEEDGVGRLPADLEAPGYGTGTLADVLPAAAAALGAASAGAQLSLDLPDVRRIAVLLVDGLGAQLLAAHPDDAPVLTQLASRTLDAPCPTTTPVSLATLGTGRPPGSHGILGFTTAVPGTDQTLNHVQWKNDPRPDVWQDQHTVFEDATAAGIACTAVLPYAFAGTGLTTAVYRGAEFRGSVGPGDLIAGMRAALAATPRALVYGYTAELDTTGHVRGVDSAAWRAQLRIVDQLVEQLLAELPGDTALLVTADHGMVDVPPDTRLDVDARPELGADVRLLAGEPRARYVHARPGAAADVLDAWQETLGGRAWVVDRQTAIDSGIFGPVRPELADRLGDVVALARGTWAFLATKQDPGPERLVGFHGSLTRAELAVPLLVGRGDR